MRILSTQKTFFKSMSKQVATSRNDSGFQYTFNSDVDSHHADSNGADTHTVPNIASGISDPINSDYDSNIADSNGAKALANSGNTAGVPDEATNSYVGNNFTAVTTLMMEDFWLYMQRNSEQ
jgi:hypothetical protein